MPEGTTSVSGSTLLGHFAGHDLDLVVLVPEIGGAADRLRRLYPPLYEDEWRDDWAAFRDPGPPQVDIVLTRPGTLGDRHHRLAWQLLAMRPDLLQEYRELKATPDDYERRKREFFERVVSLL